MLSEERKAYHRAWNKRRPDLRYARYQRARLKKYGLTPESYKALLEKQNYNCAICLQPLEVATEANRVRNGRSVVVDHKHITGEVRGLLHNDCNRAIGLIKENPDTCLRAAEYLLKFIN